MKKQLTITLLGISLIMIAACDNGGNSTSQAKAMQPLQLLVNQALMTAAYGANLKLDGDARGQALLSDASALLRRALSGPEMAMMHKGGRGISADMKRTHDIGDAAFDLLGLMMALTPDAVGASQLRQRNEQLAIAASASSLLLQSKSAGDFKQTMQEHAQKILQMSNQPPAEMQGEGAYHTLVNRLLEMLAKAAHQTPDKS
ncbi:MAG: hypothetical protein Q9M82_04330 [Mariprofundus sp.]|nr:hypothetical protein [Mariprofundus sp.]